MKKIVSLNANGLRSAMQKNLHGWLEENGFDCVCIQETKMDQSMADEHLFGSQGYRAYWSCAEKKGYSGVMTLTKEEPLSVVHGCGIPEYDREGRFVLLDFGQWSLLNVYIPSGSSGEDRHEFKMKFLDRTLPFFKECIRKYKNLIVVGDYNIVHEDIDIHNPERKDMPSGFRPEERSWLHTWFSELFVDSFRVIHPSVQEFSWWSYRAGSYDKNKGWRIDYHSITPGLKDSVKSFEHQRKFRFSDHCPLVAEYEI